METIIKPFKQRFPTFYKEAKIYRNLNRKGVVYSIQQQGLVTGHGEEFYLQHCKMTISKKGQQRVRENKVKNVHAFIKGELILGEFEIKNRIKSLTPIYYNPYKTDTFVIKGEGPVSDCNLVYFCNGGVFKVDLHT